MEMKNWRPHNWEALLKRHGVYADDAFSKVKAEAGADAILESLCDVLKEMGWRKRLGRILKSMRIIK